MRRAAKVLRKCIADFISRRKTEFHGFLKNDSGDIPGTLQSFIMWILNGEANLNLKRNPIFLRHAITIGNNVIYCFKTDRQMDYKPSCPSVTSRNHLITLHHTGIRLASHKCNRDKQLLRLISAPGYGMISAPGYGMSLSYSKIILWEIRLANAVLDCTAKNDGICIPFGLLKGSIVCFHADNFAEDTKDEKGTTHVMNVVAFQRKLGEELRTLLSLEQDSQSKKLKDNNFNDLEYYNLPSKRAFQCSPGVKSFSPTDIENVKNFETKKWLLLRSFEFMFSKEGKNIWADIRLQLHDDLTMI